MRLITHKYMEYSIQCKDVHATSALRCMQYTIFSAKAQLQLCINILMQAKLIILLNIFVLTDLFNAFIITQRLCFILNQYR